MIIHHIPFKATVALLFFAVLAIPARAQTSNPLPPPSPPTVTDALKQLADTEKDLRRDLDTLNLRFDAAEKSLQSSLSASVSHSQSVLGSATAQIYACTAMILVATLLLGFSNYQMRKETQEVTKELNRLAETTTKQINQVQILEQKLQDEIASIEKTNRSQEAKLVDLEKGRQLVTEMEVVAKSHQPPNKIKREIIALLLLHEDWPTSFRREITQALRRWNGDGEEAIAAELSNSTPQASRAAETINPQGSQNQT